MGRSVAFLFLTKNEESSVVRAIRELRQICREQGWDDSLIFIVDDSSDRTRELAKQEGAQVIEGDGRGLGAAYFEGVAGVMSHNPDFVVTLDGDGQTDLTEIPRFLEVQAESGADLVLGSRFLGENLVRYAYRKRNRLGAWMLAKYLSWMTGQKITDSHGGIRVLSRRAAQGLQIFGAHTYVQESIVDVHERGLKIIEIPSVWKKREVGCSRVVHSIGRYALRVGPFLALRALLRLRARWT